MLGSTGGGTRERWQLGIYSKGLFDLRAAFVVWEQKYDRMLIMVWVLRSGGEFWEIYIRSFQYNVDFGCHFNSLVCNKTDRRNLCSWWRLNLMYIVLGYKDSVHVLRRTQFFCMWNRWRLILSREIIAALFWELYEK